MRLFIALNLPKRERTRIHRAAKVLRDLELPVHWSEPEHYHLTLKFLGTVQDGVRERIESTLEQVAETTPPLEVRLAGFGAFPTIRKPRVLWVGVHASPELRCLKQDLEWSLAEHGFARETRAFHPHVTVGRALDDDGAGAFRGLDDVVAAIDYEAVVRVKGVDLMRSHLSRGGSRYSVLRTTVLGGPS